MGSKRVIRAAYQAAEVVPYCLDFEFDDTGPDTIPISMGIACGDGRRLYLEFAFDEERVARNAWVSANVVPLLSWPAHARLSLRQARDRISRFVRPTPRPQFWGYYGAYDWYLYCKIYGGMLNLPRHHGHLCMDVQQFFMHLGSPQGVRPPMPGNLHNARADAVWTLDFLDACERHHASLEREPDEASENSPYVCPGCFAVGEDPCAPGCIDDAIRRQNEDDLRDAWIDGRDDDEDDET